MKQKTVKRVVCLLLSAVMLMTAGCGNTDQGKNDSSLEGAGNSENDSDHSNAVMGRYVEEEIDLSESLENVKGMKKYSDGKLEITDSFSGVWESIDNGASWENASFQWLKEKLYNAYIMDLQTSVDGTLGIIYDDYEETLSVEDEQEAEEEAKSAFDLSPECALVGADGSVIPVSLDLTEEELYANRIWMTDEGRIFITTLGNIIYEIKEDGSSEAFLTTEGRPMLLQFWKNLMLIDGYDFDAPLLYDMEKREYVEDDVLTDFVKEYESDRGFNGGSWYDLYYFFDEDGALYLAGKKGLYRHVTGEDEVEQLIDGNLSRLGSPQYGLKSMVMLDKEEFLAVFSSGRIVRFTFDPNVPAMPDEKLKVYSLEDNYSIRTAIAIYQIANPDVFVEYEIGMGEDNGVTREDALKKLNTQIMAGEGPDLLMLDGLPVDSYIEKGLLLDLSGLIDEILKEEELFENLLQVFEREDAIYAVPGEVSFPVMLGREKYVSNMSDLEAVADEIEKIRGDNPEKDILGICSEKSIMKIFSVSSEPAWKKENGEIDLDAVAEFLTQMKRIYDAQMDGIGQKWPDRYESASDWYSELLGENWLYNLNIYGLNTLDYVGDYTQFMIGMTTYPYGYYDITSAARAEGFEDTMLVPAAGQSSHVFVPETILGINAAASKKELAEDFLKEFLGEEIQYALGEFAVNKTAFDALLTVDQEELGENNEYGSMAMIDEDGVEVKLDVYYPDPEELAILKGWMATADTPYIADAVLEETIFEEGEKYIQGNQSLEEALDEIEKQLAIYLSE